MRQLNLSEIVVKPVSHDEENQFQELMGAHHYLGALPKIGHTLWYVAIWNGVWVALLSFSAAALKCGVRDRWIGWDFHHQYDRLHLIANNSRFLILPEHHHRNLASRVLALCERRLVQDWTVRFGYPLLLLETFVDPRRFHGTIYRAANWHYVGNTQGYRRTRTGYSAQPIAAKYVFVRTLHPQAQARLSQLSLDPLYTHGTPKIMIGAEQMRSLPDFFTDVTDPRRGQGRRHPLPVILALAAAATLCGMRGYKAIHLWANDLGQKARARFRCRCRNRIYEVPSRTTFREVLARLDPTILDQALQAWNAQYAEEDEALALDGKTMCNAIDENGHQTHILGVIGHQSHASYAQKKSVPCP